MKNLKEMQKAANYYQECLKGHAPEGDYFFAFSPEQFNEGKSKINIKEGEKLLRYDGGLFGTKNGIDLFFEFYRNQENLISKNCCPISIFYYEYGNNECMYSTEGIEPALKATKKYFPDFSLKNYRAEYKIINKHYSQYL
jgi:hypothetical protein